MNNPGSPSNATASRGTLKLKVAARPALVQTKTLLIPQPEINKTKPGARWDDEHKKRMQAEMDALVR